ncbi:M85 family metallopeptidase [Arsenophonus nasoniae]|uniref:M85 family metallopeptidase n=1 Tax=Arsenophonus nasoniae TaxID=638 RepID=UPI00387A1E5C
MNNEICRSSPSDDAYAQYIISVGSQFNLSPNQIERIIPEISRAVAESRGFLISPYTSNAIELTIIYAIYNSITFQNIIAFGVREGHHSIESIRYQNQYQLNHAVENEDIEELNDVTFEHIECSTATTTPIVVQTEASERSYRRHLVPCVNISPAPNAHTSLYPFWQEALIHEIIHHVTGSGDPSSNEQRMGPTELLARQVADDMDWVIPLFTSYNAQERVNAIRERDFQSLRHTLHRNPRVSEQVMHRLADIGDGIERPVDFSDIHEEDEIAELELPQPNFNVNPLPHFSFKG